MNFSRAELSIVIVPISYTCVANEGLCYISEGIIVCTLNVRLLVQYVSRRVVMRTRDMML